MFSIRPCCRSESANRHQTCRTVAAVVLIALGTGISLALHAHQAPHWWLPVMLLVLAHGAILSGIVWIIARHGRARPGASADAAHCCQSHAHSVEGKVIRSPRFYDWLVRVLTLGGERKFRRWTLNLAELQPGG